MLFLDDPIMTEREKIIIGIIKYNISIIIEYYSLLFTINQDKAIKVSLPLVACTK